MFEYPEVKCIDCGSEHYCYSSLCECDNCCETGCEDCFTVRLLNDGVYCKDCAEKLGLEWD
jgi:hypothetical protein